MQIYNKNLQILLNNLQFCQLLIKKKVTIIKKNARLSIFNNELFAKKRNVYDTNYMKKYLKIIKIVCNFFCEKKTINNGKSHANIAITIYPNIINN